MGTLVTKPTRTFGAASPVIFKFTTTAGGDVTELVRYVTPSGTSQYEREYLNNEVTFDLSQTAMRNFGNTVTPYSPGYIALDTALAYPVTVADSDGETIYTGTAINAVYQQRGSFNMGAYEGKFLTEFKTIYNYGPTFPLWIGAMGRLNDGVQIRIDGITLTGARTGDFPHVIVDVNGYRNAASNITLYSFNSTYRDNRAVKQKCVPTSACAWVRWINQLGGYDYWMFSYKTTESNQLSKVETYFPEYLTKTAGVASSYIPISAEAKRVLTVGANLVPTEDFDVLKKIIYSPKIEIFTTYDQVDTAWQRVYLEKATVNKVEPNAMQSLTLDFVLQIQHLQI